MVYGIKMIAIVKSDDSTHLLAQSLTGAVTI